MLERLLLTNVLVVYTSLGFGLTGWYHDWKTMIVVASLSILGLVVFNYYNIRDFNDES